MVWLVLPPAQQFQETQWLCPRISGADFLVNGYAPEIIFKQVGILCLFIVNQAWQPNPKKMNCTSRSKARHLTATKISNRIYI